MMLKLYVADLIKRLPIRKRAARGNAMIKYSIAITGIAIPRIITISVKSDPSIKGKNSKDGTIVVTWYIIYNAAAIPPTENRNGTKNLNLPMFVPNSFILS